MIDYSLITNNIRKELKTYLQKSGLKSVVLGISGGIDSALCVALAKPVCDELGVKIFGRFITIESNKQDEIDRGNVVGNVFCHDYEEIDLTHEYEVLSMGLNEREGVLGGERIDKIRLGNVKARLRMIYIYNLAQLHKGMVLSTDNFTELMLSFFTLHGDVGDYGMVQNLWKMEVYGLSKWIALNEGGVGSPVYNALIPCVDAIPTDGLGITDSDFDQLGVDTYDEVDQLIKEEMAFLNQDNPVAKRVRDFKFKRENPYNIPRDILFGSES